MRITEATGQAASGWERVNMANGTITLERTGNGILYGQIVWEATSQGAAENVSVVTAQLQIRRSSNQWTTTGTWTGRMTIGSQPESFSWYGAVSGSWVTVHTMTVNISHNADGVGECYLYGIVNGPTGTTMQGTSVAGSQTVALDEIARFATIISGEDFTDEGNPTITYSNPAVNTVSRLQACIADPNANAKVLVSYRNIPIAGNRYTFELTDAERTALQNATPDSNTLSVKFYIGSTIGEETKKDSVSATMRIINAMPSASLSVEDTNTATRALTGDGSKLIALHSIAQVTMNASARKGATIPSDGIKITNGKNTLTGSGTFSPVQNKEIEYTVTDSRGNEVNGRLLNVVIPYINPSIVIENAVLNASGNMTLRASGKVFDGSFGSKRNSFSVKYRYKAGAGSYSSWKTFTSAELDGNNFVATAEITGLDYQTKYTFQAAVYDSLHTDGVKSKTRSVITRPIFDWGENDFKFNVPVYDQTGELIGNTPEEWQNPPMLMGTQYRTRERHLGKAVFVKLIDLGTLPNATSKSVAHGIESTATIIGFEGFAKSTSNSILQQFPIVNTSGVVAAKLQITKENAVVYAFSDLSGYTGYVKIKYTKG